MGRPPSFKIAQTEDGWKVEIPASLSASGKRERAFFKTRDQAKAHAANLRAKRQAHGENAAAIRPALAEEATKASEMLAPVGLSLIDAARIAVGIEEAKIGSEFVEIALAAFVLTKEAKSEAQVRAYEHMRAALAGEFAGRKLSTITGQELLNHVEATTGRDSTFNRRAETIRTFWRWCAKAPRTWCDSRLIDVLERKDVRRAPIGILTHEECRQLLQAAESHYPECVPGFAISLFTGIRRAELERLEVSDFTEEGIVIHAASAKTGRRRFIHFPMPLEQWLAAYPLGSSVLPANWTRKEKAIRRLAGWKVWSDLVQPATPPANRKRSTRPPFPDLRYR
ncbi:hypothetical protein llg_23170 [Luteolibacter sp. LG18]|nr:hypothetical protein llg_23170 [Luteolibacter sp. LG18]